MNNETDKSESLPDDSLAAYGVETLIERLRDEGVAEGRAEAEKIVSDAEARAEWLLEQAHEETETLRREARSEVERHKTAGEQALQMAARDALLSLKGALSDVFAREVERLVTDQMQSEALLKDLILAVAGRVREQAQQAERLDVLLPRNAFGLEELRRDPDELARGELTGLVRKIIGDNLRAGVVFKMAADTGAGLKIHLVDEQITLDLSEKTVAALLLEHLQPRFRALLEGIVK